MDKAKDSVKGFLSKSGKHDTTVHEKINPAVQNETISRTKHEEFTPAIDREIHQDHYHTSEQPIHDSETLPEQHHHNEVDVEDKSFKHHDEDDVQRRLKDEQSKYRDQQHRVEGQETRNENAVVEGEHVHHHIHENIQPVVHKQTVEPHVVHTTVPVHEVHHNSAQHHSASALPAVTMDEFKKGGGSLSGREERHDAFSGEPRAFGGNARKGGTEMDGHGSESKESHIVPNDTKYSSTSNGTASTMSPVDRTGTDSSSVDRTGTDSSSVDRTGTDSSTVDRTGTDSNTVDRTGTDSNTVDRTGTDSSATSASTHGTGTDPYTSRGKPSLMDKLNPKKDANGDGKVGFMK